MSDADLRLVAACRVLAAQGHAGSLAGQVSVRTSGDDFRSIRLGVSFAEVGEADLVELRGDDAERPDGLAVNPALRFHRWIYRLRPDVHAIVHTHPPALTAWSMLGRRLPVAHMDAAMFFEDCGFLERWPGVPIDDEEGRLIGAALGSHRGALLVNHGYVAAGASLAEAVYLAVFAERAAGAALRAAAVGPLRPIDPAAARDAHDFLLQPAIVDATFDAWAREVGCGARPGRG